jgi:DNA invertase Pin-like site-specific DNA recombinase
MSENRDAATRSHMKIIGYVRVSTGEQAESGAGLDAQRAAIQQAAALRGFELVRIIEDAGASGKTLARPGLVEALDLVESDRADGIMVAKLDRFPTAHGGVWRASTIAGMVKP